MTELEKLEAGLEYSFWDAEVSARKQHAIEWCGQLNQIDPKDEEKMVEALNGLFGSCGEDPWVGPNFNCDYGLNIHVGDRFLANYNVTILDIAPVRMGSDVMIGPGTLICTVGHPLSPKG
ncbi:MAG: sugar O-acetyltransferase, partial [Lachnospiraceae bacterium]|nr:sugar O-acetyltransferase [Lachnospiraceae bacterium]